MIFKNKLEMSLLEFYNYKYNYNYNDGHINCVILISEFACLSVVVNNS